MKIRAAVLEEFGQPLSVQELDLAEPRAGEALVRLVACGVCHTDLYTASGADPSGYSPTVLGHEGAGVVETVGEGGGTSRARSISMPSSPTSSPSTTSTAASS
jgi:S-(hydroxymethyl)glutathione dehydrogenase / alcohol dehydrogenase